MTCKNCDASVEGKFCSNCGQKTEIHRVTFGHLVHEFFHAMTHTDKGILLLLRELIKRPGHVTTEYLAGKRKKYFNPLSFLVITTAASALISYKSGYYEALSQSRDIPDHYRYYKEAMEIMVDNGKMLGLFLIVPLVSFFSWLFFRKPRYNFAEHFVLQSYVIGFTYVFTALIVVPIFLLMPQYAMIINSGFQLFFLIYMIIAYKQFFDNNVILTIIKSILIMLFFIVFFWIFIFGYVIIKHQIFH